jgi:hypothetical protein
MTSLQILDAVLERIKSRGELRINKVDAEDVKKITESDLILRDFSVANAEASASGFAEGDIETFAKAAGTTCTFDNDEPSFLGN